MDSEERQRILLSRGYFPKELPLVFTTEDFGKFSSDIVADWKAANIFSEVRNLKISRSKKKKSGSYSYKFASTEMETISMPKKGYERRNIHITHPIPQAVLSSEISANWQTISRWVGRSKYTLDEISISNGNFRGIKGLNFEAHRAKKAFIEANAVGLFARTSLGFIPQSTLIQFLGLRTERTRLKSR